MKRKIDDKETKQNPFKKDKYEPPIIESEVLHIAHGDEPSPINPISALDPFFEICCPAGR